MLLGKMSKKVKKREKVRAIRLKQLLTAAGGFREDCANIMGDDVALLSAQVLVHPHGTYFPQGQMWSTAPVRVDGRWEGGRGPVPGDRAA